MKQTVFIILFLVLGISFAALSTYLSIQQKTTNTSHSNYNSATQTFRTTDTTVNFDNADFGALSLGIISASCFLIVGNIITKSKTN